MADKGRLKIQCFVGDTYVPVEGSNITLVSTSGQINDNKEVNLVTNSSGESQVIELNAPPLEYSQNPDQPTPYSLYDLRIDKEGFQTLVINGVQIFPGQTAIQQCQLIKSNNRNSRADVINIGPNTLNGNYPSKIPEEIDKPLPPPTSGVVLPKPVVPEFITVHTGSPSNNSAPNYTVLYKDYIKNVASSEIYPTWPESAIYANILVIQSFTLNRVFTEWYRGKGYDFTITSSTAYDQKWIYGRNVFEEIDYLVDSIFTNYLSRPGVRQPIFTSYCDGNRTTCRGLSQWGSKSLAEQGYSAIDIIHYYYGNDMYINSADIVSGVPSSWPGYDLTIGSSGEKVRQLQQQLNRIARNYPAIPTLIPDGIYGPDTAEAVRMFQKIFHLPQTGIVDYPTWFEISDIYVGVTRISEPDA